MTSPLSVGGVRAEELLKIGRQAGRLGAKLKMVDVSEYNPMSEDFRTGKLATTLFYFVATGLSENIK